jgi:hypothetical protein
MRVPLEAVGLVGAAPGEGVLYLAVRAGDVVAQAGFGGGFALFDVAQALDARGGAADDLGVGGALQALVGQGEGVCALL